jgi:hypothetical protein
VIPDRIESAEITTEKSAMKKKYIQPGEKVALRLTAPERMLVLECVNFLDDCREAPKTGHQEAR